MKRKLQKPADALRSSAMEWESISANHVSPKNDRSKENEKGMLFALLLMVALLLPGSASAQLFGPPKTAVTLEHPPQLGLKVNKIVFNQATGECADQVVNELIALFVQNNVEVIDRDNLTAILNEQNFAWSGYVDQSTAMSLGKIIGPSAMITAKVLTCQSNLARTHKDESRSEKDKSGNTRNWVVRKYAATLTVNIKVSIQTVDLTTGRIFAAKVFDSSQKATEYAEAAKPTVNPLTRRENPPAEGTLPAPPDEYALKERALLSIVKQVHPLFFPWTERVEVAFFRDAIDEKGSKKAWDALKVGNYSGAVDLAAQYLEWCKDEKNFIDKKGRMDEKDRVKSLSHAYYNCGTLFFILNDYDSAIKSFQQAQELLPTDKYIADAKNKCIAAKSLAEENLRIDTRSAAEIAKSEQQAAQMQQQQEQMQQQAEAKALRNADVITMTKNKMPKSIIIKRIDKEKCSFDLSTDALTELQKAGVDEEVIGAMMDK